MSGGDTLDTVKIEFHEAEKSTDGEQPHGVVTVDPNIPLRLEAISLSEIGGAPSAMLMHLLGDNIESTFFRIGNFRSVQANIWPKLQRFYEYYLHEEWQYFDTVGKQIMGDKYPKNPLPRVRDSISFRALSLMFGALENSRGSAVALLDEFAQNLHKFHKNRIFIEYAISSVDSGLIAQDQRRLWDCTKTLMNAYESWLPGMLADASLNSTTVDLSTLRLCRDDFSLLRDIYVSCFEACCKALRHVIAAMNTSLRGDPEKFRSDLPSKIPPSEKKKVAKSLKKYDKLVNFEKLAYLDEWPTWGLEMPTLLNNRIRNSIGHNSVRHDLRSGFVINDSGEKINYLEFTRLVYEITGALFRVIHAVHTVRIIAAENSEY